MRDENYLKALENYVHKEEDRVELEDFYDNLPWHAIPRDEPETYYGEFVVEFMNPTRESLAQKIRERLERRMKHGRNAKDEYLYFTNSVTLHYCGIFFDSFSYESRNPFHARCGFGENVLHINGRMNSEINEFDFVYACRMLAQSVPFRNGENAVTKIKCYTNTRECTKRLKMQNIYLNKYEYDTRTGMLSKLKVTDFNEIDSNMDKSPIEDYEKNLGERRRWVLDNLCTMTPYLILEK